VTPGDRAALEALNSRFDHTAAIARLVSYGADVPGELADALRGISETLGELSTRMDDILNAGSES